MKISNIKTFYLEDTKNNTTVIAHSLIHACELAVNAHDTNILIHIGGYNLDYYNSGDSVATLYNRCTEIIKNI